MQKHHCLSKNYLILPVLPHLVDHSQHVDGLLHHIQIAVTESLLHNRAGCILAVFEEAVLAGIIVIGYVVSCLPMELLHDPDPICSAQHRIEDIDHVLVRRLLVNSLDVVVGSHVVQVIEI